MRVWGRWRDTSQRGWEGTSTISQMLCVEGGQGGRGSSSCAAKPAWAIWLCFPDKHLLVPVLMDGLSVWHSDCSSGWRWRKLQALAWSCSAALKLHMVCPLPAPTPGIAWCCMSSTAFLSYVLICVKAHKRRPWDLQIPTCFAAIREASVYLPVLQHTF